MSFRDFLTYFGELEICHLTPDSVNNEDNSKKFEVFHFYGAWSFGSTAGGCGNDGNRKKILNRFLREGGMASNPKMEYQVFLCIFQKNSAMATFDLNWLSQSTLN